MHIAVISDTHMPRGERRLPAECVRRLAAADAIIHAGDLSTLALLHELEQFGPPVTAVHGNVDDAATRAQLREVATLRTMHGQTIAVIHDAGARQGRLPRMHRRFPDAEVVVFGHSHLPLVETDETTGFTILNPGSPTERRRAPHHTMAVITSTRAGLSAELIDLD